MASPQPDKYTILSNELLEALYKSEFNSSQWKIILYVIRYTYGFKKKDTKISSIRWLSKQLESDHRSITVAFNLLLTRRVLIHVEGDTYRLNKDYESWGGRGGSETGHSKGGSETGQSGSETGQSGSETTHPIMNRKKGLKKGLKKGDMGPPKSSQNGHLTPIQKVVEAWKALNDIDEDDEDFNKHEWLHHAKRAKELLSKFNGDPIKAIDCMEWVIDEYRERKGLTVVFETVIKHVFTYKNRETIMREGGKYGRGR